MKPELFKHNMAGQAVFISCSIKQFDGYLGTTEYISKEKWETIFEKYPKNRQLSLREMCDIRLPVFKSIFNLKKSLC